MSSARYPELTPRRKPIKRAINQIVLCVLGRAEIGRASCRERV